MAYKHLFEVKHFAETLPTEKQWICISFAVRSRKVAANDGWFQYKHFAQYATRWQREKNYDVISYLVTKKILKTKKEKGKRLFALTEYGEHLYAHLDCLRKQFENFKKEGFENG